VDDFSNLVKQRNVVVTTYKRDGTGVPTVVNVVVIGDHAYFRTWSTSGKAKRLRRDPRVLIAPSNARGKVTGPAVAATARLLTGEEEIPVRQALAKKYPVLQGRLVLWAHRFRHYQTVHYELTAGPPRPRKGQIEARSRHRWAPSAPAWSTVACNCRGLTHRLICLRRSLDGV